jgi:hypothetical protein
VRLNAGRVAVDRGEAIDIGGVSVWQHQLAEHSCVDAGCQAQLIESPICL